MNQCKKCRHCCSTELLRLKATCLNDVLLQGVNTDNTISLQFLPLGGRDDSLDFVVCVSCGQIDGRWRLSIKKLNDYPDREYEIVDYHT